MNEMGFWTRFILAVLATWRITHLLAREDGPGGLIARFRGRLGSGITGKLMDCFQCLSFWIAAPMAFFICRKPLDTLLAWLALSGAACLLERMGSEPVVIQPISQENKGGLDNGMLWSEARGTQEHVNTEDNATRHTTRS